MKNCKTIYVFDIDGTLADVSHRVHHVQSEEKSERNWKAFYDEMENDTVIDYVADMMRSFYKLGYTILVVTGRSEEHRHYTEQWLCWNNLPYDELHMRCKGDMRKDYECKRDLIPNAYYDNIACVFEDKQSVVDMWREEGLNVIQIFNGE